METEQCSGFIGIHCLFLFKCFFFVERLKVRAHNLLWNMERHQPQWVRVLKGNELNSVVQKHIHDTVLRYKGL